MNKQPTDTTDRVDVASEPTGQAQTSAWELLRQTRESHGVHLVVLASALKVPTKFLEALEAGDIAALPDPVFARALAASVCRHMGVDPDTVLRHWPRVDNPTLKHASTAHSITPTTFDPYGSSASWGKRALWVALALAIGGGLFWLSRSQLPVPVAATDPSAAESTATAVPGATNGAQADGAAGAATTDGQVSTQVLVTAQTEPTPVAAPVSEPSVTPAAPVPGAAASEASPVAAAPSANPAGSTLGGLQLTASARTWVEVRSQSAGVLISRILAVGETFTATEGAPWSVVIGNTQGVQVTRNGSVVDVAGQARGNVARLQVE